jgi:hypothetical protein
MSAMDELVAPMERYDQDNDFRARIGALYDDSRPRFIGAVIDLTLGEGYGRRDALAFAREVTMRVAAIMAEPAPRELASDGRGGRTYEIKAYRMIAGRRLEVPDGERIVAVLKTDHRAPGTPAGTVDLTVLVELDGRQQLSAVAAPGSGPAARSTGSSRSGASPTPGR